MRGHFGRDVFNTFSLAYELGRALDDVANMSEAERVGWLAFFALRAEEAKKSRR
ncbi:MAG: hypothetical protein L7V86_25635 [Verrucomicrobiales bacterium]|jgi:hypothetical protein|nr:hypothetical protein [Verrucomicrobiales bacterium]